MNFNVTVDWKFLGVLGVTAIGAILTSKLDSEAAERVSTLAVDAFRELVTARKADV